MMDVVESVGMWLKNTFRTAPMWWALGGMALATTLLLWCRKKGEALQDTWDAHVVPHGPLRTLFPDQLYAVEGRIKGWGEFPREMVVYRYGVRRGKASLLIHSPVALDEDGMAEMEALGVPTVLIVPNPFHRLDCAVYKKRYPDILVLCPKLATQLVGKVVKVDGTCEEKLESLVPGCKVLTPRGFDKELTYQLDVEDGHALVCTDMLFNLKNLPGFFGWIFWLLGSTGQFCVTPLGKFFVVKNKKELRDYLYELSDIPNIKAICVAHGAPIVFECSEALRTAAGRV